MYPALSAALGYGSVAPSNKLPTASLRRDSALQSTRAGRSTAALLALLVLGAALPATAAVVEQQKLTSADFTVDTALNLPDARYGEGVAISGSWMAVGSPGAFDGVGRVQIYQRVADAWVPRTELVPPVAQAGAGFGAAVDVFESAGLLTVIVGAPLHDGVQPDQGRAYIYSDTDATAAFAFATASIDPASPQSQARFGAAVALYADAAAIAAPNQGSGSGLVSIRGRGVGGGNAWGQVGPSKAGSAGVQFGSSVDLHGEYLIVGAPTAQNGAGVRSGLAYVYRQDQGGAGAWGIRHTLAPTTGAQAGMAFGRSVGIWDSNPAAADSATRSVVGAPLADNGGVVDVGAVVFFADATVTSTLLEPALAGNLSSQTGYSVALEGAEAIAGRPGHNIGGGSPDSGLVNTYSFNGAAWVANTSNIPQDGAAAGSAFGSAVDLSGLLAVASAPGSLQDDLLLPPGAVQAGVVETLGKPGAAWIAGDTTRAVFELPDITAAQQLGTATALAGEWMAAGVQGDSQKGVDAGAVYMYRNVGGVWTAHSKLTALYGMEGDRFGHAVALVGETLVVGAPGFDGFPIATSDSGAIYLFEFDGTAWVQRLERPSPDPEVNGQFGYAVDFDGDVLAVGAVGENGGTGRGYAYRSLTDLDDPLALDVAGLQVGDRAGESVSVYDPAPGVANDEVIAIGAPGRNAAAGAAWVFSGPAFATVNTLGEPAPASNRYFGRSVAIFDGQLAVGAPTESAAPGGAVHVFSGAGYASVQTLVPSGSPGQFGGSVAIDATTVLVGAPASNGGAGLGMVFSLAGGSWTESELLQPADLTGSDAFGSSVALSFGTYLVAAPLQDANAVSDGGSAYVFGELPEVLVAPTSLAIAESGSTIDSAVINLSVAPSANVSIELTFDSAQIQVDSGAGFGFSPQTVTLTPANAITGVTVEVRATDDAVAEADPHATVITTASTVSSDVGFNGLLVDDIDVSISDNDAADVVLVESGGSTAVTEGSITDSYTFVLASQPSGNVQIVANFDQTQLVVGGETDGTHAVTFTPLNWNVAQSIAVVAVDDTVLEGPQLSMISHGFSSSDPDYNDFPLAEVTVSITDNETAEVVFASAGSAQAEGAIFNPGVRLLITANGTPGGTLSDDISGVVAITGGTATPLMDVAFNTQGFAFPAGSAHNSVSTSISVDLPNDRQVEAIETFTLEISITDGLATSTASNTYSITDNDSAALTFVSPASSLGESAGIGYVQVLLTLNTVGSGQEGLGAPIGIGFTEAAGSASSPADYTVNTGVRSFGVGAPDGETLDIAVVLVNDRAVEGNETFQVGFGALTTDVSASAVGLHTATIVDDDTAVVEFASAASMAPEAISPHVVAAALSINATGTGTASLQNAASVQIVQTPGSAATPADYSLVTTSVPFAAGAVGGATQAIEIAIVNDAENDPDETLTLGFGAVTGQVTASGAHEVTIEDNDAPGITLVQSGGGTAVTEGGAGDSYTVVLDSQPSANVVVDASFNLAQLGVGGDGDGTYSFTFTPVNWNVAQTVTVAALNDTVVEGPHVSTITHGVSSSDPAYDGFPLADVPVSIVDNDTAEVIFASAGFAAVEGASFSPGATLRITANGSDGGSLGAAVSGVLAITGGTATEDVDVTVTTADFLFPAGSVHDTVNTTAALQVIDDRQVEPTETFSAALSITGGLATTTASNDYSIVDNDSAAIAFASATGDLDESAGTASIPALLTITAVGSGPVELAGPISIAVNQAPGSASTPADYVSSTGSLTFPAGTPTGSTQNVEVALVNDRLVEGTENFQLGFGALTTDLTTVSATGLHTATIVDDDTAVVEFASAASTAPEGVTPHVVNAVLTINGTGTGTASLQNAASVAVAQTPGSAATPADYSLVTTSVAFAAGAVEGATQAIDIAIVDDSASDPDETFTLGFGAVTGPVTASGVHLVTIDDNDSPGVSVVQGGGSTEVAEGGASDSYTLVLDTQPSADVTINLGFDAAQLIVAGQTSGSHSLLFTPVNWNVAQTVMVEAVDDAVVEVTPQTSPITQTISSSDAGYAALGLADLGVAVADNDSAVVSFNPAAVSAAESAGTLAFTVTLSNPVASGVTLTATSSVGTADAGDFDAVTAAVVSFAANSTTPQTITVTLIDDALDEDDEQFSVDLADLTAIGDVSLGVSSATGTLIDDDAASTLSINSPSVPEATGGVGTVDFVVTVTPPSGRTIAFTGATADGTATVADNDYVALAPQTLTIAPGQTSLVIPVTVIDDAVAEPDETFQLLITDVVNAEPSSLAGTATLLDDDQNPTVTSILGSTPNPSQVGEVYTVDVQVSGTTASPTGSVVIDDGSGESCGSVALVPAVAPDSTASCQITSSSSGSKTLTAVYTPSDAGFSASSGTADHVVSATADLVLTAATPATPVLAGTRYAVELTVANAGPDPAQDVQLTLPLPASTGFASVLADGASCSTPAVGAVGDVICTWAGATAATGTRIATIEIVLPASTAAGAVLDSTASVTAQSDDPQPANNSATVSITAAVEAELALELTANPTTALPGQTVNLTATALNNGPSDAPEVSITVDLPGGLQFSSVSAGVDGSCTGNTSVTCSWTAATTPGTSRSMVIATRLTAVSGGGLTIDATATSAASTTAADAQVVILGAATPPPAVVPTNDLRPLLLLALLMLTIGSVALRRRS